MRAAFAALDLQAFVKNTGGSGLHVVVPLVPERSWRDLFALARRLSEILVEQSPGSFTTSVRKRGREGKILLDYLRNNRTNTSVAAYSVRARPKAPVSTPLSWDELDPGIPADHFTVGNLERRLARLAADPWRDYARVRQRLDARTLKGLGIG
jgi:bifunctional non-homologous end joining protein LigD